MPITTTMTMGDSRFQCGRCGHAYSPVAWRGLARVRTLDAHEVNAHVLVWPIHRRVEIRVCTICGLHLARSHDSAQAAPR